MDWETLFSDFRDAGFWVQVVCAAVFTYMIMGHRKKAWRKPFSMAGKVLFLIASFLIIRVFLSALAMRFPFLEGARSWLPYIAGVTLFGYAFCRYSPNARRVTGPCCFSSIIIINELGVVLEEMLGMAAAMEPQAEAQLAPQIVPQLMPQLEAQMEIQAEAQMAAFNGGLIPRIAVSLLLIPLALFLRNRPVWRYEISNPAANLSVFSNALSALTAIIYDYFFQAHFFEQGETIVGLLLMCAVMAALFLLNLVCYQMIYRLSQEHTSVLELQAATQMNKSAASLMAVTESNLNELHKINHDIQNQYAYMRALLARKAYDELDDYFAELTGTFSEPLVPVVECGNRVLDIIFNMERAKAQEMGVGLDVLAAPPHELPFRDLDLCNLYANVIDNAMEACVEEKIADAQVSVTVNVSGDYLFTRVSNPTTKDVSFLRGGIGTTKRNKRTHGKGLSIVRGIVRKYGGTLDVRIENGTYVVEFLLDTCVGEEEAT